MTICTTCKRLFLALIVCGGYVGAASLTWDGNSSTAPNPDGGTGTWNVNATTNWWNGTTNVVWPALGGTDNDAVFANNAGTVTLGTAITANDLTFNTAGYTISGANTLTLNGTTPTITTAPGVTATINSALAGSAGLTKAGSGTLTLGSRNNGYTGATTVTGGTLALNGSTLVSSVNLAAGTTLQVTGGQGLVGQYNAWTGSGAANFNSLSALNNRFATLSPALQYNGSTKAGDNFDFNSNGANFPVPYNTASTFEARWVGRYTAPTAGSYTFFTASDDGSVLWINGQMVVNNNFAQGVTERSGSITLAAGAHDIAIGYYNSGGGYGFYSSVTTPGGSKVLLPNSSLTSGSAIGSLSGAATSNLNLADTSNLTVNQTAAGTFSGTITGSGGIFKTGLGTLTLDNATNNYTGSTTFAAGTTSVSTLADAGTASNIGSGSTMNFWGGTLQYTGANASSNRASNLMGNAGFEVTNAATNLTLSGAITAPNNVGTVTKLGAGTVTFSGTNTYTGNTIVNGGTLKAGVVSVANVSGAFGNNSAVTLANTTGVALDITGFNTQIGSLAGGGTTGGNVILGSATLTTGANNTGTTFAGVISGSGGGLTKTGSGVQILSGVNTYTGVTTISGGTLSVATINNGGVAGNLGQATNAAANLVFDGGTLQYTGVTASTDRNFTINAGKTATIEVTVAANALTFAGASTVSTGVLAKNGAGTLILTGNNAHTGGTTINGGELQVLAAATAGAKTHLGGGLVSANSGTTLRIKTSSTSNAHSYANNFALNGATFISEDGVVTYGGTIAVTGSNTFNVVHAGKNAIFTNTIGGAGSITKTGSGDMILSGANGYSGTTTVSGGTLSLTGLSGAIASSTAITINSGATLRLDNTNAANNGDRVGNTATMGMSGGTLNFSNNAGAVNYSETIGALSLVAGNNTISVGQAAVGQTTTLTFASLTRNAAGSVNFTGTGLGVDSRNRILITSNPTLSNGLIGLWATYNSSRLASYDPTLGVIQAANSVDVTRLNSGTNIISNGASNHVSIIEGTGTLVGNLTLGSTVTTINSLNQTASGGSSAGIIDVAGKTLRLGLNSGIVSQTGSGVLAVGLSSNSGSLTAGGADNMASNLALLNNSSNAIVINSAIINNGSGVVALTTEGTGIVTLAGNSSNTYTGITTLSGAGQLVLSKSPGAVAIPGDINMSASGTRAILSTTQNNQFGPGSVMRFTATPGDTRFELKGTTQTLGGLDSTGFAGIYSAVQHSEFGSPGALSSNSTLVLDVTGASSYTFGNAAGTAALRNQGGIVALTKMGTGTQTLLGSGISYSGTTLVQNGNLVLDSTTAYNSPTIVNTGGTLTNTGAAAAGYGTSASLTLNGGAYTHATTAADAWRVWNSNGGLLTIGAAGGTININNTNTTNNNVFFDAGIAGTGTLTLNTTGGGNNGIVFRTNVGNYSGNLQINSGNVFVNNAAGLVFQNSNVTLSSGATLRLDANFASAAANGSVKSLNGNGTVTLGAQTLTMGTNNGGGSFSGLIGGTGAIIKTGTGTQILGGANTFTGSTAVNNGNLTLDYSSQNNSKLSDTGALILGGGTLELSGGSHTETVVSTTINAGLSSVFRNVGTSVLQMNAITRNAGGMISFGSANIASTDTLNTNGILGAWATLGNDWAVNSTNTADGLITAYTGYTDITRLNSGPQVIGDASTSNVRIIDGTGSPANITLGAVTTNINTVQQTATGGTSTISMSTNKLRLGIAGGILSASGTSALMIGTAPNEGTLTAGGNADNVAGDIAITNNSTNAITINSVIANNGTGVVTLGKAGAGTLVLTGTNTYTGATNVGSGTLEIGGGGSLGASGIYAAAITNNGVFHYNSSAPQTLNGLMSGTGSLVKGGSGTLTLGNVNNTFTGGVTVNQGTLMLGSTNNGISTMKGIVTVNTGGTLDWNVANALGYNAGSIASLNINGGIVGGGDLQMHFYHSAGSIPITMTGGTLKLGGPLGSGGNQFRSAPITVIASGTTSQILGVTANGTMAIRDSTTQIFDVGNGSQAVDLLVDVVIAQNSGTSGIIKNGAGTMRLNQANTFGGTTRINAGTLSLTNNQALQNSQLIWDNLGGTLDFSTRTALFLGGLQGSQNLTLQDGSAAPLPLTLGGGNQGGTYTGALLGGSTLTKLGTGTQVLAGASSHTFSGTTTVYQGALSLGMTGGAKALGNELIFDNNLSPDVYTTVDNQFGAGTVISFVTDSGDHGRFDLMGTTQTVAGIRTVGYGTIRGVIQNSEAIAHNGSSTLVLNGSGSYAFNGYLRNQTGLLSLVKNGSGTQTLSGNQINYTGGTTVNSGILALRDTTGYTAATVVNSGSTLDIGRTALGFASRNLIMGNAVSGSGTIEVNNSGSGLAGGWTIVNGGPNSLNFSGVININSGVLSRDNTNVTSINGTATVNIGSGAFFGAGRGGNSTIGALNGSGVVSTLWSGANAGSITVGNGGGSGSFSGVISGNGTNGTDGTQEGGILSLTKVGNGTQTLSGTNTYSGTTSVNGGKLQLDFASGGTSNILSGSTAVSLGGGILEIKGGSGEANTQTINGISGSGTMLLTPNGATSINATLGAVGNGSLNFVGSDGTVASPGTTNFLTSTTTTNNNGTTRLGAHLWNGSDWASTSSSGGNRVVKWIGAYSDLTTDGNSSNPTGELRVVNGTGAGTAATFSADTTAESLLMTASTHATALSLGTNTLTVGNGVGATGAVAIGDTAQSLTIGSSANQGKLTAGTTSAPSTLQLSNQSPTSSLTINSVVQNNNATGVVSLNTNGKVILNGTNTFTGSTTISGGTLEIGGAGTLGGGTYAGTIANSGTLRYNSSANQTLSGIISGAGNLVKDNSASVLTISNAATSYSGGTIINAGTVDWRGVTGVAAGTMTVNAGGILTTSLANTNSNLNGPIVLNGGTISSSVAGNGSYGNFTFNSTAGVTVGGSQRSVISADVRMGNNATVNFHVNNTGDPSGIDLEITGTFSHYHNVTWGYMSKSGPGTIRFNSSTGTNNIGSITVNEGKVILANMINNGGNGGLTANANGTIDLNPGSNQTFGNPLRGAGVFNKEGVNTLTLTSNGSTTTGTFNINSGRVIAGGSQSTGLGNVIVKSGTILQSNGGDFFGFASNTSQLTIQGGTVTTNTGGAFRTTISKLVFDGGGELTSGIGNLGDANGQYSLYNNNASTATVRVINPGATTALITAPVFSFWGNLTGGTTFDVARGTATSDLTISSVLRSHSNSTPIVKAGAGILTFSGNNVYVGATTINEGTLALSSTGSINSNVTVNSGATFTNNGLVTGDVTVNAGGIRNGSGRQVGNMTVAGIHRPGNSPGIDVQTGNYTLAATGILEMELDNALGTVPQAGGLTNLEIQSHILNDYGVAGGFAGNDAFTNFPTPDTAFQQHYDPANSPFNDKDNALHDALEIGGNFVIDATLTDAGTIEVASLPSALQRGMFFDLFDISGSTGDEFDLLLVEDMVNMGGAIQLQGGGVLLLPELHTGGSWSPFVYDLTLLNQGIIILVPEPSRALFVLLAAVPLLMRRKRNG